MSWWLVKVWMHSGLNYHDITVDSSNYMGNESLRLELRRSRYAPVLGRCPNAQAFQTLQSHKHKQVEPREVLRCYLQVFLLELTKADDAAGSSVLGRGG